MKSIKTRNDSRNKLDTINEDQPQGITQTNTIHKEEDPPNILPATGTTIPSLTNQDPDSDTESDENHESTITANTIGILKHEHPPNITKPDTHKQDTAEPAGSVRFASAPLHDIAEWLFEHQGEDTNTTKNGNQHSMAPPFD